MSVIESTLSGFLQHYRDKHIMLAYSGGIDSQVLLHAIYQLKQQQKINNAVTAIHVNHGLSNNANQWQQFAIEQCRQRNIELAIARVSIEKKAQQSLEAQARLARYQAIKRAAPADCLVLTGHHSDDQSETLLLALKRGAGLKGLGSMKRVTVLQPGVFTQESPVTAPRPHAQQFLTHPLLARPLLENTRADITAYARQHQLCWVDDESNDNEHFDRNFLRHTILPLLTKRWPGILSTINRSAGHCQEAQQLLDELAGQDIAHCLFDDKCLSVSALKRFSLPRFNNIIRHYLSMHHAQMPSTEQLQQLYLQLQGNDDSALAIKIADRWFRRYRDGLYFTCSYEVLSVEPLTLARVPTINNPASVTMTLPDALGTLMLTAGSGGDTSVQHPQNQGNSQAHCDIKNSGQPFFTARLLAPAAGEKVQIRFNHDNPTCRPDFRQHSRPLKKVLQELSIAPWLRKRIPFIYYDDTLVAALGYFVCKEYLPVAGQPTLNICWLDGEISG